MDEMNPLEEVRELGSATGAKRPEIHCLAIVGQIEGHSVLPEDTKTTKYEHILPLLAAVEESPDIAALLVLLNTAGGDVEAGLAIAELIAGMSKPTASLVLGGGHSIGVPLAVAASRSFIAPSAAMMLHPVRLNGVVIGAPQTYDYFQAVQKRVTDFITAHSHIGEEALTSLMMRAGQLSNDIGTCLSGPESVERGIIDAIGGLGDALDYLHSRI